MRARLPGGVGSRIAGAAILVSLLAVGIVAAGALVFGAQSFVDLMTADGHPASEAHAMFDASIGQVVLVGLAVAIVTSTLLAVVLAGRIARPLREVGRAARRIADGDYKTRVPRQGPDEVASLADSFNEMAVALEEQERLRREFIANSAHEIKTPLTNLQGYLEALRDDVVPADRETFQSLWDEAERLVRLARSLDVLADGESTARRRELIPVDVASAGRSAVELAGPAFAAAGLTFEVDLPPALPVLADPDGLAQVFGNLLQNAIRYTPAPGSVWLRGERRDRTVWVSVSNTGPGIPAGDLPHVFERFYRVEKSRDASRGGAGIGLAMVHELIDSFGGSTGIESRDGRTEVWFSLPATASSKPARPVGPEPVSEARWSGSPASASPSAGSGRAPSGTGTRADDRHR
jgi:two-component system sensor histidine kinase BaeS